MEKLIRINLYQNTAVWKCGLFVLDAAFQKVCAEIGTTNDGIATEVERTIAKSSKYEIFCPTCHKTIGEYSRMCKTIQHIEQCQCKGCGKGGLKVIQNW